MSVVQKATKPILSFAGVAKEKPSPFDRTGSTMAADGSGDNPVAALIIWEDLPEALIIWEILVRLPPEDVFRCRAVRRSWRHATSTRDFLLANHRRQPVLPILNLYEAIDLDAEGTIGIDHDDPHFVVFCGGGELRPVVRYAAPGMDCLALHGAIDGLLLVSSTGMNAIWRRFYLCNPATCRCAPVRQLFEHKLGRPCFSTHVVGFYQHQPSGEYRVLYWLRPESDDGGGAPVYYVLTVENGGEPRCIGRLGAATSPSAAQLLATGLPCSADHPPVLYRGCLYWGRHDLIDDDDETLEVYRHIPVFDVVTEKFRWMRRPFHLFHWTSLLEMNNADGTIGLGLCGSREGPVIEFWVLEDYDAEIWSFKRWINLEALTQTPAPPVDRLALFCTPARVVVFNEREVLISILGRVLQCDVHGNFLGLLECGGRLCHITGHSLRESILQHPFFEMQEEIAVNENDNMPMPFLLAV
ncbi:hypothetical protein EJB05_54277, partial [Eragrostis curvula]